VTGIKNEPGGCAPLLELANVLSARAGRHPSAWMLGRNVAAHDERIDVFLLDFPVDPVVDDQQGIAHRLGQMGLVHGSLEIFVDGFQRDDDGLLAYAIVNAILGYFLEQLRIHQDELLRSDPLVILAQVILDHFDGNAKVVLLAVRLNEEIDVTCRRDDVAHFNHTWSLQ
jgi:hypothetical protein